MALYDQGPAHQFSMAMLLPPTQKRKKKIILVLGTNETPKTLHIYKCIYLVPPEYKLTVTFSQSSLYTHNLPSCKYNC